jgi:hypothetical protein
MSTLAQIRTKVRRLTGRPSPQQITDAQIDEYINTFYLYDMPETLRLVTQESVFEFMTEANVGEYDLNTLPIWTGIANEPAVDIYLTVGPPAYVAGYQCFWSQDREQFFRGWPQLAEIKSSIVGDGSPGPYTINFANTPILAGKVTVGSIDSTDSAVNARDIPTNRTDGTWEVINSNTILGGSINYLTGSATITFNTNIPAGNKVTFTAVPYQPARPLAMLFYQNVLTLRPVPDQSYLVTMNAYKRPTALLAAGESPELQQWWQYLAYGAAKKIFEDSQDPEGLRAIAQGLGEQERLVLRRTLVVRTTQRTATIYTEMTGFPYGNFNNRF